MACWHGGVLAYLDNITGKDGERLQNEKHGLEKREEVEIMVN